MRIENKIKYEIYSLILCLLMPVCAFVQNNYPVTGSFKKQFVGKWYDVAVKNHPNSIEINLKTKNLQIRNIN